MNAEAGHFRSFETFVGHFRVKQPVQNTFHFESRGCILLPPPRCAPAGYHFFLIYRFFVKRRTIILAYAKVRLVIIYIQPTTSRQLQVTWRDHKWSLSSEREKYSLWVGASAKMIFILVCRQNKNFTLWALSPKQAAILSLYIYLERIKNLLFQKKIHQSKFQIKIMNNYRTRR